MEGSFPPPSSHQFAGLHRRPDSDPKSQGNGLADTKWTNEKHSEYLQSMEASFVDQLYNSVDVNGALIEKDCTSNSKSSRQMHVNTRIPAGQFKVLRDGCWTKVNVKRGESPSSNAYEPHDLLVNPWIRHFASGRKHQNVTSPTIQRKTALASINQYQPHSCHHNSDDNSTEVTDQNFVDVYDEEVGSHKSIINKMKTSVIANLSSDQVVPCKEFTEAEDARKTSSLVKNSSIDYP